jgi:hypothetical protein
MTTTGTGERFDIPPSDWEEARGTGLPPRKNLIRDCGEQVEVRNGRELPVLENYGARPALAARVAEFVRWLGEQFEER